jgi:hypothetical protein
MDRTRRSHSAPYPASFGTLAVCCMFFGSRERSCFGGDTGRLQLSALPLCAQTYPPGRLVREICGALSTRQSLLIIDGVDEIEALWRGGALGWLLYSEGPSVLGQTRCLVTSRAAKQAAELGAHVQGFTLTPADNEVVMEKMLAHFASGGSQSMLHPPFQVRKA